jgi:hypothetical protein
MLISAILAGLILSSPIRQANAQSITLCGQYVIHETTQPGFGGWISWYFVTEKEPMGIKEPPFGEGFYRLYGVVVESWNSTYFDGTPINKRVASWSRYEKLNGYPDCAETPTLPPTNTPIPPPTLTNAPSITSTHVPTLTRIPSTLTPTPTITFVPPTVTPISSTPQGDAAGLFQQKRDQIKFLSELKAPIEIFSAKIPFIPVTTYRDQEQAVEKYLGTLDPVTLKPAQVGSLKRLIAFEDGLKRLWAGHFSTTLIVGKHISNVVMIGFGTLKLANFLDRPDIAHKLGGFATKIAKEIRKKIFTTIGDFLMLVVKQLPNQGSMEMQILKGAIERIDLIAQIALEKDPRASLPDLLGKGALPYAFAEGVNTGYIAMTGNEITTGLDSAKRLAERDTSPALAANEVRIVEDKISSSVNAVTGAIAEIERNAAAAEKAQDTLKVATDLADIAALATTLSPFNGITRGLTILTRVVDGGISSYFIVDAGASWIDLARVAKGLSNEVFATSTILSPEIAVQPVGFQRPGWAPSMGNAKKTLTYSPALIRETSTTGDELKKVLMQLDSAVRSGDSQQVLSVTDLLLKSDPAFESKLRIAQAPVYEVASNPNLAADPAWRTSLGSMAAATSAYNLSGAVLYTQIAGYVYDPTDSQSRSTLLETIREQAKKIDSAIAATDFILPQAEKYLTRPVVVIADIDYPAEIVVGSPVEVKVVLVSALPLETSDVTAKLIPEKGMQLLSQDEVQVGSIAGGSIVEVKYKINLTDPSALGKINAWVANGAIQTRGFALNATTRQPESNSGLGIFLVIGIIFGSSLLIFTVSRRQRLKIGKAKITARLSGIAGEFNRMEIPLVRDTWLIGRGSDCDLRLQESSVSRHHALLRYAQGAWYIQDQGSAKGILINGQRTNAARLHTGDQITIAGSSFIFSA